MAFRDLAGVCFKGSSRRGAAEQLLPPVLCNCSACSGVGSSPRGAEFLGERQTSGSAPATAARATEEGEEEEEERASAAALRAALVKPEVVDELFEVLLEAGTTDAEASAAAVTAALSAPGVLGEVLSAIFPAAVSLDECRRRLWPPQAFESCRCAVRCMSRAARDHGEVLDRMSAELAAAREAAKKAAVAPAVEPSVWDEMPGESQALELAKAALAAAAAKESGAVESEEAVILRVVAELQSKLGCCQRAARAFVGKNKSYFDRPRVRGNLGPRQERAPQPLTSAADVAGRTDAYGLTAAAIDLVRAEYVAATGRGGKDQVVMRLVRRLPCGWGWG